MDVKRQEQEQKSFKSHYFFDDPPKTLGEGAHATVFKCYKKSDPNKLQPFAVKCAREPDEEKRMAHQNEFKLTNNLNH